VKALAVVKRAKSATATKRVMMAVGRALCHVVVRVLLERKDSREKFGRVRTALCRTLHTIVVVKCTVRTVCTVRVRE
jgi:hypothetical protein